jgi:hypothetical protein
MGENRERLGTGRTVFDVCCNSLVFHALQLAIVKEHEILFQLQTKRAFRWFIRVHSSS